MDPRFRPPYDVFYPGVYPWDPFTPVAGRRVEDDLSLMQRELEDLEDEKLELESEIEDLRKEIERRKKEQAQQSDVR